jgi:hypothetical protein
MLIKYILLALLLCSGASCVLAGGDSTAPTSTNTISIKPGAYSILDLVLKLRSKAIVNFEEGSRPTSFEKINVAGQNVMVDELASEIQQRFGYKCQVTAGAVIIRNPDVDKLGDKDPMNIKVGSVEFTDVPLTEVFRSLSLDRGLPLLFMQFGHPADPKVTLHLDNISIRDLLDDLVRPQVCVDGTLA